MSKDISPFEKIRRVNSAGHEFWSSRDFALLLSYTDYRNFETVVEKARMACFNSGQRLEDHFVDITEMVEIGSGAQDGSLFKFRHPELVEGSVQASLALDHQFRYVAKHGRVC